MVPETRLSLFAVKELRLSYSEETLLFTMDSESGSLD